MQKRIFTKQNLENCGEPFEELKEHIDGSCQQIEHSQAMAAGGS